MGWILPLMGYQNPWEPCVLPPTEEGRGAEARTRHPRDPGHPGQPSRFQWRFPCSATGGSGDKHLVMQADSGNKGGVESHLVLNFF